MTSAERKEIRYQRRKLKRQHKQVTFNEVFTIDNLTKAYKKCRRNVSWKASVQSYITEAPLEIYKAYEELQQDIYHTRGFYEFDLVERGKLRHIKSVHMRERVIQRCLCDNALVPTLSRSFIYDNGACLKNKGYTFASNRIKQHLRNYYNHYGQDGYILMFDFSKFFDNISHETAKAIIRKSFTDEKIIKQIEHFIDAFGGEKGLGLGSQISQIIALSVPNVLDHYIKEKLHIRYYGRYMDDGYLIHRSKEYLQQCLLQIRRICDELHIILNLKKTQIIKLSHGFTYLKVKYFLTSSGKVIKRLPSKSITRMRRKLKMFKRKNKPDMYESFQSWCAYAAGFNSYRTVNNLKNLYKEKVGDNNAN